LLYELQSFIDRGGPVLVIIMIAAFFMWMLLLERLFYFRFAHNQVAAQAVAEWRSRKDRKSTYAHWVREQLISEVRQKAEQNVHLTKTIVAIAPLFGLLGTVTGMVQVFDVMAITNGADAKAMSAGVSRATVPTMAGMVVALSGIIFASQLDRRVNRSVQAVEDQMEIG
jgi:biopolymer transport protein ExbB